VPRPSITALHADAPQPSRTRKTRDRVFVALSEMRRDGLTIQEAARRAKTTPRTMHAIVPRALKVGSDRRVRATGYDRYARRMSILTPGGKQEVSVRSSRTASLIAEHLVAVDRYLKTGNRDLLDRFRDRRFRAGTLDVEFLTDGTTLKRLGHLGEVGFEDLYPDRA
jgi:hypothetical protein